MNAFELAVLSLVRRRIPSAIALVAIALSVAGGGILFRLYLLSGARFAAMASGPQVVIGAKTGGLEMLLGSLNLEGDYPGFLPYVLFESLRARRTVGFEDGVAVKTGWLRSVIPLVYFGRYGEYRIIGTDGSFVERPEAADSLRFQAGRWAAGEGEVVLGAEVARARRLQVGDRVAAASWTGEGRATVPFSLTVVGVFAPTATVWDRALFADVRAAQAVLGQSDLSGLTIPTQWGAKVVHYVLAYLEPGSAPALAELINRRTVGQMILVEAEKRKLAELTFTGRALGFLMTGLILLLGGLCVTAMLVTRFDSMTVQLAILRAIGYGKGEIAGWLLWEGLILGVLACVLGGALEAVAFPWLRVALGSALPGVEVAPCAWFMSAPVWGMAIIGTVLAVFIPLYHLYRQDVHQSLKGL